MRKVVIINASPRKDGNCSKISEYIIKKLNELSHNSEHESDQIYITYLNLREMGFTGCIDCGYCTKNRGCVIKDDIQNMYSIFDESDITITVTPIYFDGTPWKLKAMIDRMQAIYNSKYILENSLIDRAKKRRGFTVSIAGGPEYDTQFQGNKNVLEFMYKSINTELVKHINISDTDHTPAYENKKVLAEIEKILEQI